MATLSTSQTRKLVNLHSLSLFRHCSSATIDGAGGDADEDLDDVKPKSSSTKTRRAKTMARLINNTPNWSSDLESSLSSLSPSLSKTTVLQTLRLVRTPAQALNFFNWTQHNGFVPNDQSYFLMLEILGRTRNLNAARNFLYSIPKRSNGAVKLEDKYFNSLIRNYDRAGLFQESIKVFTTMKSIGVSPSIVTFNSLLSIVLKRGRISMAHNLFDEMLSTFGVTPDTYTFNILIRGFCMNSMVDQGFCFFKEMDRFNCEPDIITYNTIVDGLCRAGKVKIAHNVVKGMLKKQMNLNPNVVTYTTLIRGYCAKQEIAEAVDVLKEMIIQKLKPNHITYNTLIQGLCESQELDKLKEIINGDFVPDTCTFNTLMKAHCNAGNPEEAMKILEKMNELRVRSDSATYSVLIRSFCRKGEFEKAESLFDELVEKEILLSDAGCTPLVAAYNPMFELLCRNGKTKKADRVFRQLIRRGKQDPPAFETLITGHLREKTYEDGYNLLILMLRRDYKPNFEIFEPLIDGLLQINEPNLALDTLKRMLETSNLLPQTSSFHSILAKLVEKGCAGDSSTLIMLMLEKKIRQNINLSTKTLKLLFKIRSKDKAFEVIRCLYENGYEINMGELIFYLCESRKLSEAREMLVFSLAKDQSMDIEIYSEVISSLCKFHSVLDAFSLYYEVVEQGIRLPLSCLEELRIGLEAEGRSKEVEFISKRMLRN